MTLRAAAMQTFSYLPNTLKIPSATSLLSHSLSYLRLQGEARAIMNNTKHHRRHWCVGLTLHSSSATLHTGEDYYVDAAS